MRLVEGPVTGGLGTFTVCLAIVILLGMIEL